MKDFKGTKGEWIFDEKSLGVTNNNVVGLLATAWSVYNTDKTEVRMDGESWLDMRTRTNQDRVDADNEKLANAKLIASAPDLLEALQLLKQEYEDIASSGDCGWWDASDDECIIRVNKAIDKALK